MLSLYPLLYVKFHKQIRKVFFMLSLSTGTDFMVPGGFNVTIMFGGEDDRQPFPLDILEDMVGEGDETIELLLTTPGRLDGVIPGMNSSTKVVILKNDCKYCHLFKNYILCMIACITVLKHIRATLSTEIYNVLQSLLINIAYVLF